MKTIVFLSDTHCGSIYGLTPPKHFTSDPHHSVIQREGWNSYMSIVNKWLRPDVLVINGDCIEGTQCKQGGAELITSDRNVQVEMAVECFQKFKAKKILMTFGTAYHVGEWAEDFEYMIAKALKTTISGRLYFKCEGLTFDVRHKVGSSSIPHGRATALLREVMWDLLKEADETGPHVDVIVRSHVHYHIWVEGPRRVAFTTPCLQLSRGRYGSRECMGETHWGAIRLTVDKGQIVGKDKIILNLLANKPSVLNCK